MYSALTGGSRGAAVDIFAADIPVHGTHLMNHWFVYIVRCADNTLYTGITTDIVRRIDEHNNSVRVTSAYTHARRPVVLVYQEECQTRSMALKREHALRQLSRREKDELVFLNNGRTRDQQ